MLYKPYKEGVSGGLARLNLRPMWADPFRPASKQAYKMPVQLIYFNWQGKPARRVKSELTSLTTVEHSNNYGERHTSIGQLGLVHQRVN